VELHNLYSSPSIVRIIKSRRTRGAEHVARMGGKTNVCRILLRKPGRKIPLIRPRCRLAGNTETDFREIE
jgi:hypothetical protein